jgi:hypothetical protein
MSTFAKMAPALRGQLVPYAFRPLEKWIGTGAFEILESDYSNLTYREKSGKFNENGPYESRADTDRTYAAACTVKQSMMNSLSAEDPDSMT